MVTHPLDQTWTDAETEQTMAWAVPDRKGTIRCHLPNSIRKGRRRLVVHFNRLKPYIEPVSHKPTQAEENTTQQYIAIGKTSRTRDRTIEMGKVGPEKET